MIAKKVLPLICLSLFGFGLFAQTHHVNCRMELDRDVLLAGDNHTAILRLSLETQQPKISIDRPPVNLAIALDRSGSMQGDKLEKAKEAAIAAFQRLSSQDRFALVIYDDRVETLIPMQPVSQIQHAEQMIRGITAGSSTALFGGVSQAAAEVRKSLGNAFIHRIILLSDGLANVGPSSPEDLGRLGTALAKERITVSTVGVGNDYNEDLMTRLSQGSDGNTYYVESSADLPRIFKAELGDIFTIVARDVRVKVSFPPGIRPIELIGREGKLGAQDVEVVFNELYGSQEKYALVRIAIDRAYPNQDVNVAQAGVHYLDAVTQEKRALQQSLIAKVSADEQVVAASSNHAVQRGYYLNQNAVAQDRAISLADQGNVDDAVKELQVASQELQQIGAQNKDVVLLEKAKQMDELANEVKSKGMTKKNRKVLRTDNYQTIKQQKQIDLKQDDDQD